MDRLSAKQRPREILREGLNCWRIATCQRAAVLVDAAQYFSRLEATLRQARRSILILGWDFDGTIRLRPDASSEASPELGSLLRSLVEARPRLEVRVLVWSIAVLHAPSAPIPLLVGAEWQRHPRIRVKLDSQHPIYAAHHQKIVVVDDSIAFVGGIDLTLRRWDSSRHLAEDATRVGADAQEYCPVHDVQMVVDGEAARAVAELARHRWHVATGARVSTVDTSPDLWPPDLVPHFTQSAVGIARTMPAWADQDPVQEAADLTARALEAAQRSIYVETQYLTATYIRDILERRLSEPDGPEVIMVTSRNLRGVFERLVMTENRDRLIRRLRQVDRYDRLIPANLTFDLMADPHDPRV